MTIEPENDRVINGLLKADIGLSTPDQIKARLAQNMLLVVAPQRSGVTDLWPAIWFLASIIEREFTGKVFIKAGLDHELPSPIPLGPRCVFVPEEFSFEGDSIGIGISMVGDSAIWGDVRGSAISYKDFLAGASVAHPVSAVALAGYLGFAALARAANIPPFHEHWKQSSLFLPFDTHRGSISERIAVLGVGQIGQAFLALNYFLAGSRSPIVHIVDKDIFEDENYRTQILLTDAPRTWVGQRKVDYLASVCRSWGWRITNEHTEINWGWKSPLGPAANAFLGFDNMMARRVGIEGGFKWLVECGVGTDFCKPRVSWHSLPPDRELAKRLFIDKATANPTVDSEFMKTLAATPGGCGKVIFDNVQASAPCLGAIGAAFAAMELLNAQDGNGISGSAFAWSPLLPLQREELFAKHQ
jgi:hypothetical protein